MINVFLVRQHPRYTLEIPVEAHDGDRRLTGRTRNVSLSGCSIIGRVPLTVGREHVLRLHAPAANDNAPLELPAVVVWCSRVDDAFEAGFKFQSGCAEARDALDALIARAAASQPALPDPTAGDDDVADPFRIEGFVLSERRRADPSIKKICADVIEEFWNDRPDPLAFPRLATQLIETLENPDAELKQIVALVQQEPAVAASLLKAANSPLFRRGAPVPDLAAAVVKLGLRTVGQLASGVASQALFDMQARATLQMHAARWKALFHHSLTTAFAAASLAERCKLPHPDRAFSAGLLHDVGKSLALRSLSALQLAGRLPGDLADDVVDEVLERTHVELGSEMHVAWTLPDYLQAVCAHHHDEVVDDTAELRLVHVVRVVSGLATLRRNPEARSLLPSVIQSVRALGLDRVRVRIIRSQLDELADKVHAIIASHG